jgi:hypothetical protein
MVAATRFHKHTSRGLQLVELDANGNVRNGGYASYLDNPPCVRKESR